MIHLQKITVAEFSNFVPFPYLVKANRPYAEGDIIILDQYDEVTEMLKDESENLIPVTKEFHTGQQFFFKVEKVMSADNTKGIRKGFHMLKLKRVSFQKTELASEETTA